MTPKEINDHNVANGAFMVLGRPGKWMLVRLNGDGTVGVVSTSQGLSAVHIADLAPWDNSNERRNARRIQMLHDHPGKLRIPDVPGAHTLLGMHTDGILLRMEDGSTRAVPIMDLIPIHDDDEQPQACAEDANCRYPLTDSLSLLRAQGYVQLDRNTGHYQRINLACFSLSIHHHPHTHMVAVALINSNGDQRILRHPLIGQAMRMAHAHMGLMIPGPVQQAGRPRGMQHFELRFLRDTPSCPGWFFWAATQWRGPYIVPEEMPAFVLDNLYHPITLLRHDLAILP